MNGQKSESDAMHSFTCQIVSGWIRILFWSDKLQVGCYSTWLTFQRMSEPFQIIFEWSKVRIRCYTLFYIPNSVWMDQNIILIRQTPNQMLFNLIDIPNIVWTIQNNFWMVKSRNQIQLTHLHTTQCLDGPKFYFLCETLRISIYSTQLTCQIMFKPFRIIFEWSKVGIG